MKKMAWHTPPQIEQWYRLEFQKAVRSGKLVGPGTKPGFLVGFDFKAVLDTIPVVVRLMMMIKSVSVVSFKF